MSSARMSSNPNPSPNPNPNPNQVVGLQGAPQHNGKPGYILSHDAASDRYLVALDATHQLRLKRSNLRA